MQRQHARPTKPHAPAVTMQAAVYSAYGSPEEVTVQEVPIPDPGPDDVLVQVKAAGVNPGDRFLLEGTPYVLRLSSGLRRPKRPVLGLAVAGSVARGGDGALFGPGDEVFAEVPYGAFADFVVVSRDGLAAKPPSLSFAEAAAVPVCGVAALQALRDVGNVEPRQEILITGASGGVGTFAVQIGKWLGAHVTGVCSGRNVELVRSLGADEVIDYTSEDFTSGGARYDLVLDNVGAWSLSSLRRVLKPRGMLIPNANKPGGILGSYVATAMRAMLMNTFVPQRLRPFSSQGTAEDLATMGKLIESGVVRPVIDTSYRLSRTADALRHYATGHASGKIVVDIDEA